MDARELRIGNWVKVDDLPPEQVTLEMFAALQKYPHTISVFQPIPITEQILLDCGFEKDYSSYYEHPCKDHEIRISFEYEKRFYWAIGSEYIIGKEIKFLHELQNVCFALTGTELTYRPI